jgi:hypothetical protein
MSMTRGLLGGKRRGAHRFDAQGCCSLAGQFDSTGWQRPGRQTVQALEGRDRCFVSPLQGFPVPGDFKPRPLAWADLYDACGVRFHASELPLTRGSFGCVVRTNPDLQKPTQSGIRCEVRLTPFRWLRYL